MTEDWHARSQLKQEQQIADLEKQARSARPGPRRKALRQLSRLGAVDALVRLEALPNDYLETGIARAAGDSLAIWRHKESVELTQRAVLPPPETAQIDEASIAARLMMLADTPPELHMGDAPHAEALRLLGFVTEDNPEILSPLIDVCDHLPPPFRALPERLGSIGHDRCLKRPAQNPCPLDAGYLARDRPVAVFSVRRYRYRCRIGPADRCGCGAGRTLRPARISSGICAGTTPGARALVTPRHRFGAESNRCIGKDAGPFETGGLRQERADPAQHPPRST